MARTGGDMLNRKFLNYEDCEIELYLRETVRGSALTDEENVVTALVQALASNRTVEVMLIDMKVCPGRVWSELVRSMKCTSHLRHLLISVDAEIPMFWSADFQKWKNLEKNL